MITVRWAVQSGAKLIAAVMALTALADRPASAQGGRTFYVDFESGSNDHPGTSVRAAWKHAPGDSAATGAPARTRLAAGDTVLFRGGVAYRGNLRVTAKGTAASPIVFRGDRWGSERAVLSGRDAETVDLRRCSDDPVCARFSTASDVLVADVSNPVRLFDQVALDGVVLNQAQGPQLRDPFFTDDITSYFPLSRTIRPDAAGNWRVTHPQIAAILRVGGASDMAAYVWGIPNTIYAGSVVAAEPAEGAVVLNAPRFRPYTDRDSRFAIINHVALIRAERDFATIDGGRKVTVLLPGGPRRTTLETSRRPVAIQVSGAEHVVFQGFVIEGFAGAADVANGGVGIWVAGGARNVTIRDNHFRDLESRAGSGAVQAFAVSGLRIEGNVFERLKHGSGVRAGQDTADVVLVRNRLRRMGRTGIAIIGTQGAEVVGNYLDEFRGVHGNALSVYLHSRDVRVANNAIVGSTRAITFHGRGGVLNDIVIRANAIAVSGESSVGIQSWGQQTVGVEIVENVVLAPPTRIAVHLNTGDRRVSVTRNKLDGLFIPGAVPADWRVTENVLLRRHPPQFRAGAALQQDNRLELNLLGPNARGDSIAALCDAMRRLNSSGVGPPNLCDSR